VETTCTKDTWSEVFNHS